jgi:hypothetical protein
MFLRWLITSKGSPMHEYFLHNHPLHTRLATCALIQFSPLESHACAERLAAFGRGLPGCRLGSCERLAAIGRGIPGYRLDSC